ncbi:MAG: hypothetical protein PHW13_02465 [Methylococcales bacterium]|nr:hypothetical protein [Methylococcales bacterium]
MKKLLLEMLAIFLIIEEWLWDALSACGHYLIVLLRLESFERWLSQTPPNTALLAFLIPVLIVTPVNLAAIWLMLQGLLLQGLLLEIFAKLLATLLVARVFALTKTQLLSFGIIAAVYTTIRQWLQWAHEKIVDTDIYRYSVQLKAQLKARVRAFLVDEAQ